MTAREFLIDYFEIDDDCPDKEIIDKFTDDEVILSEVILKVVKSIFFDDLVEILRIYSETKNLEVVTFEQILREEFLINTQNYPKEYHDLFFKKFNRAETTFREMTFCAH